MARMEHGRTVMQNREDDDMVELDTSLASVRPGQSTWRNM
jgi:hypothetical protein